MYGWGNQSFQITFELTRLFNPNYTYSKKKYLESLIMTNIWGKLNQLLKHHLYRTYNAPVLLSQRYATKDCIKTKLVGKPRMLFMEATQTGYKHITTPHLKHK